MLLTVQQEDPDSPENESEKTSNVSEDELDMMLATMGTTSLKDSEMELLQEDGTTEEEDEEGELDMMLATMGTTSLQDAEMELLQNDGAPEDEEELVVETRIGEPATKEGQNPLSGETNPALLDDSVLASQQIPPSTETSLPASTADSSITEQPPPASRKSARRVVRNFFKKLRKAK